MAIGKDAIAFMAVGLALWAGIDFNRRTLLMAVSIISMFLVRPHMAEIMILAITITILIRANISIVKKLLLISLYLAVIAVAIPFVIKYAGLNDVGAVADVQDYISERQECNREGAVALIFLQ